LSRLYAIISDELKICEAFDGSHAKVKASRIPVAKPQKEGL
jgi:hypothetical protein